MLDQLGVWCCVRGALVLVVRIEKLKMREKYERHYLILSLVYSELLKAHKVCEEAFGSMADIDKMVKYSKPKLVRLIEVLRQYKPEHVGSHRQQYNSYNKTPAAAAPGQLQRASIKKTEQTSAVDEEEQPQPVQDSSEKDSGVSRCIKRLLSVFLRFKDWILIRQVGE